MINNDFYEELGDRWFTELDHPIALLRAENKVRIPWIANEIGEPSKVLDIGCGGGFLANALALKGHEVHGIDLSESSLEAARRQDRTGRAIYQKASAYSLPFQDGSFDVVCAMDLLEHVEKPEQVIREASRVLKKNGRFFFHTFNRNWISYVIIIKGVEWCVRNTPKNMHVYPLFIKPCELSGMCRRNQLEVNEWKGFRPCFTKPFFQMLFTRKVPENFRFRFSRHLTTGYCGQAKKRS